MTTIAIQPDRIRQRNGEEQSFSARWGQLAEARGVEVRTVDVHRAGLFDDLRGCDGFMWRFGYDPFSLQFAKRLVPAVEHGLAIPVFPSQATSWHFEDKLAQHYLLEAAGIPTARTHVFWDRGAAEAFCRDATYPLVMKLASGVQSDNVTMLRDVAEARRWIARLFGPGTVSARAPVRGWRGQLAQRLGPLRQLAGRPVPRGLQHGYLYVQEFLPGNTFDTRVTVIGCRAYAFRRHNRPDDFRASGSGMVDWDPAGVDEASVRLALRVARHLGTQSLAVDGLRRGGEPVVGEISYTYATWLLRDCPGHWVLEGDPDHGPLRWVPGRLRAEDAIFEDFVAEVEAHRERRAG